MTETPENSIPISSDASDPPEPRTLEGQLLARRERRKADLLSVDGLTRENARVWRRYRAGSITEREWCGFVKFSYLQLASLRTRHGIEVIEREQLPAIAANFPHLGDFYQTVSFVEPTPELAAPESKQ